MIVDALKQLPDREDSKIFCTDERGWSKSTGSICQSPLYIR